MIELTRRDEASKPARATWEGHAALDLLMGAQAVLVPARDASDVDATTRSADCRSTQAYRDASPTQSRPSTFGSAVEAAL